jgi:hypothetical protein
MVKAEISTLDLTEELQKRPGVTTVTVEPYEEVKIQTGHKEFNIQGPAVIMINQD